jgi:transcriptional regulator with XRE-family HTH domain
MKKRKKKTRTEGTTRSAEFRESFDRSQRKLAERIAYHEARIAARERGDDPDAVDPESVDASTILLLDPSERHERTQRKLAERIAYHEARIAARERGENPDAATA